jgi:hypothetical protein
VFLCMSVYTLVCLCVSLFPCVPAHMYVFETWLLVLGGPCHLFMPSTEKAVGKRPELWRAKIALLCGAGFQWVLF